MQFMYYAEGWPRCMGNDSILICRWNKVLWEDDGWMWLIWWWVSQCPNLDFWHSCCQMLMAFQLCWFLRAIEWQILRWWYRILSWPVQSYQITSQMPTDWRFLGFDPPAWEPHLGVNNALSDSLHQTCIFLPGKIGK